MRVMFPKKVLRLPRSIPAVFFLVALFVLQSCTVTDESRIDHGEVEIHTPGYPNFHLNTHNEIIPGEGGVLHIDVIIPTQHLYYRKNDDDQYYSEFSKQIRIQQAEGEDDDTYHTIHNDIIEDTLTTDERDTVGYSDNHRFSTYYRLKPGKYRLSTTISDKHSGKDISRERDITITDVQEHNITLGDIQLKSKSEGGNEFKVESGYHLNADFDSLKTNFQLHVDSTLESDSNIYMRLLRFRTDYEPARPPHYHTPLPGSLINQGIDYNEPDTVQTVSRELSILEGVIDIDFELPRLPEGNYRVEVESLDLKDENDDDPIYRARDFAVMHSGFPGANNLETMAKSLVYITREEEYEQIMEAVGTDTLRSEFERFFGRLYSNRNTAKNVIHSYFTRVEEANLLFSNHKPGWKTDPGMIYILFGQPDHQDHAIDGMVWHYYNDSSSQPRQFIFERSRNVGRAYPTENYVLHRGRQFDRAYRETVDRWRRGLMH